ncbi:two-component response regulator ORR24-like [Triticum dicoccoides]|uniref:two-component response regulator ORR24-like n=1 Tax=Triticum dicoccoides TaxID=85692 RepID=UPI00188DCD78|nr:two-component response regulator ORR24-like [Triticum dicoccoides]
MNSPSAYGMHGLLSPQSQPLHLGHAQNNLGTSLNDLDVNNGNLIRGAHMSTMVTGTSGNSFANISNGAPLAPTNRAVQSLESNNRQHLGRINSSSTGSFSSFASDSPHFPDLGRSSNTWQTAVPSNIQQLGQNGSMSQASLHGNGPRMEPVSSYAPPSNQITSLGNDMQNQVAPLASNTLPMVFNQGAAPFTFGNSTNLRETLNSNLAFSNSGINTSLPNLRIDNSVVPRQTLDGGNTGGVPLCRMARLISKLLVISSITTTMISWGQVGCKGSSVVVWMTLLLTCSSRYDPLLYFIFSRIYLNAKLSCILLLFCIYIVSFVIFSRIYLNAKFKIEAKAISSKAPTTTSITHTEMVFRAHTDRRT